MLPFPAKHTSTPCTHSVPAKQRVKFSKHAILTNSTLLNLSIIFLCLLFFVLCSPGSIFAANLFPRYPVIESNVRFWENIYNRYSTSQAVIHDPKNLGIVYEVVPIINQRLPGSSKLNKPILKGIKKKYSRILNQLAQGIQPHSADEKRVAALFAKSSSKRLKEAASSVRSQIGQKDRFLEGVIRSGAYIAEIKKIFKKKGLPEDLAYLPHVESSFNLKAYSKLGASGIWQFTRSTGRQFLTINYVVDERQDPILASHAAAQFLKNNYKLLGTWPLALTAYNYGPAGMLRAKKSHLGYEKIFTHYNQGYFKFASRNFYSEFLAAVKVAKKLEKEPSLKLHRPKRTLHFTLPAYIATQDLCKHFKISVDTLKKLNPALRRSVLQGKKFIPKGYTLRLPYTKQQKHLIAKLPGHLYHKKQKPTKFYRVQPGDTAGKIAHAHNVTLKSLRRTNNLDTNAAIFVGQNLRIPDKYIATNIKAPSSISPNRQKITVQKRIAAAYQANKNTLPLLADSKKNRPAWKKIQHARSVVLGELSVLNISKRNNITQGTITVQPEESMELLADWLKISARSLRKLNGFPDSHQLHPDEKISIALANISAKKFEEKRFDFHLENEEDFFNAYKIVGVNSYTVQNGDTVWDICRKQFDLPLWLLKKYNTNLDFSSLRSSQQLTIPIVKAI